MTAPARYGPTTTCTVCSRRFVASRARQRGACSRRACVKARIGATLRGRKFTAGEQTTKTRYGQVLCECDQPLGDQPKHRGCIECQRKDAARRAWEAGS